MNYLIINLELNGISLSSMEILQIRNQRSKEHQRRNKNQKINDWVIVFNR
jgi:hypothetical protein